MTHQRTSETLRGMSLKAFNAGEANVVCRSHRTVRRPGRYRPGALGSSVWASPFQRKSRLGPVARVNPRSRVARTPGGAGPTISRMAPRTHPKGINRPVDLRPGAKAPRRSSDMRGQFSYA